MVVGDMPRLETRMEIAMAGVPQKPLARDVLASCGALAGLAPAELKSLADACFVAYAERGELIWIAGAHVQFAAIVGVGFVKLSLTTPRGADQAIELLGPGQCLGLTAALEDGTYALTATAVAHTWYAKVPAQVLRDVTLGCHGFCASLLGELVPRMRQTQRTLARVASGTTEQRLATVLLMLADSYGEHGDGGTVVRAPVARPDLAEMAGATTAATLRCLSKWRDLHVLSIDHQRLTLHDQGFLEAAASS